MVVTPTEEVFGRSAIILFDTLCGMVLSHASMMSAKEYVEKLELPPPTPGEGGLLAARTGRGSGLYIAARLSLVTFFFAGLSATCALSLLSVDPLARLRVEAAARESAGGRDLVGVLDLLPFKCALTLFMGLACRALASERAIVDDEDMDEALAGRRWKCRGSAGDVCVKSMDSFTGTATRRWGVAGRSGLSEGAGTNFFA